MPMRSTYQRPLYRIGQAVFSLGLFALGVATGQHWKRAADHAPASTPVAAPATRIASPRVETIQPDGPQAAALSPRVAVPGDDGSAWTTFLRAPHPAAEPAALAELTELAVTQPEAALSLALAAPSARQREMATQAVLRGWAATDADAAGDWVLANLPLAQRRAAVEALLQGAIAQPEAAIRVAHELCTVDVAWRAEHGQSLLKALGAAGLFGQASAFAADGADAERGQWLFTTYEQWAQYDPTAALAVAAELPDPAATEQARQAVFIGWARSDPASLVTYATSLPEGDLRTTALREALPQWVYLEPSAASEWMNARPPGPELDAGAVAVATNPAILTESPATAATWAESIADPQLRAETLHEVLLQWNAFDPAAARAYAQTSPAFDLASRSRALESLTLTP